VFPNGYLNFNRVQKDNNFINDSLRLVFKCQACYKIIADVFVNFSLCTHAHSRCVYDMQPKFSFAPSLTPPNFFQLPERGSGANQTEIKSKQGRGSKAGWKSGGGKIFSERLRETIMAGMS